MFEHVVRLHLGREHARKLVRGKGVRISHAMMQEGGDVPVYLTKPQYTKLNRARRNGAGINLTFSDAQAKHHLEHGGGLWDSIKAAASKAFDIGKKVYDVAKPAYDLYKGVKGVLGGELVAAPKRGGRVRASKADPFNNQSIGFQQTGHGVQAGGGFFDDFIGGVRKAISVITPITSWIPGPIGAVSRVVGAANRIIPGGAIKITHAEMKRMHGGRVFESADAASKAGFDDAMEVIKQKLGRAEHVAAADAKVVRAPKRGGKIRSRKHSAHV